MVKIDIRNTLKRAFSELPVDSRPTALVDLPAYLNIGDSLIGLGQFSLLGARPEYLFVGNVPSDKVLNRIEALKGIVLVCGGGTFGTLWPQHQRLRERIVSRCPSATIVQLPQSVYFETPTAMVNSLEILQSHPDFHLMVRDQKSYDAVSHSSLSSVTLVPDAAFAIDLQTNRKPKNDIVFLSRTDHEKTHGCIIEDLRREFRSLNTSTIDWADWKSLGNTVNSYDFFLDYSILRLLRIFRTPRLSKSLWTSLFKLRLNLGARLLSLGKVIVTDRLHAHILCSITGTPHVFFDNNSRKISNYAKTWNTLSEISIEANSFRNAKNAIERLLTLS